MKIASWKQIWIKRGKLNLEP